MTKPGFPTAPDAEALERGSILAPRFDDKGLIAAVATHADTGEVLMLAWMNAQALDLTLRTGEAHYYSRSRQSLWKKRRNQRSGPEGQGGAHRLRSGRGMDSGLAPG